MKSQSLDQDEGDEEQLEVQQCIEELKNKDLAERNVKLVIIINCIIDKRRRVEKDNKGTRTR